MSATYYHHSVGLQPEQIKRIHQESLRLVEKVGSRVSHEPALQRIAGQ